MNRNCFKIQHILRVLKTLFWWPKQWVLTSMFIWDDIWLLCFGWEEDLIQIAVLSQLLLTCLHFALILPLVLIWCYWTLFRNSSALDCMWLLSNQLVLYRYWKTCFKYCFCLLLLLFWGSNNIIWTFPWLSHCSFLSCLQSW